MGTPVVTFAGDRHAARVGASILTHAGLPDLVARDRESYIELAVTLGMDRDKLAKIRRGLRERFEQSPVMDGARLARETERVIRLAWQSFCAGKPQPA
jgi:predicted O-linked N-acetylglucosamine transferase (SPINDLY family)